jgi:hypothetical protein
MQTSKIKENLGSGKREIEGKEKGRWRNLNV